MPKTEQEEFIDSLEDKTAINPLEKALDGTEPVPVKDETLPDPEEAEDKIKNRQHKRLMERLQAQREENIALNAKLTALSEVEKFKKDEPDLDLHRVLYGTQAPTDETREVSSRLQSILENYGQKAQERAIEAIRKEQAEEAKRVKEEEQSLDSMIENIEEDHNVSLTKEQKQGFFKYMEKMSPKNDNGEVIAYADPDAVWEIFSSKLQAKPVNPAKDFASRGMVQSASPIAKKDVDEATESFLREHGIPVDGRF